MIRTENRYIPRGYCKEFILDWSHNNSEELYQNFLETNVQEIVDELLHSLNPARRQKWSETVESLNFRTSWTLLRKNPTQRQNTAVSPDDIATHIVKTSRTPKEKSHTILVNKEYKM